MNSDYIIDQISKHFNIDNVELREFINKLENNNFIYKNINTDSYSQSSNIILPFSGFIDNSKCFGVIYNHGLYTQCNNLADTFCKKCKTNRKYGTIQERAKYELGKFTPDNKKYEVAYDKFMKKMNYNLSDVKNELIKHNLTYPLIDNLKQKPSCRGRPKKNITCLETSVASTCTDTDEEIEVEEIKIEDDLYYRTNEDVILDRESHEIIGILVNGKIINRW